MIILRYADDIVVGFQHEDDAWRFWDAMRARLEEFSLALHPDKTRLLEFGRKAAGRRKRYGLVRPETFTFLGFIFICGRSRRGAFQLQRKTRGDRMRAKLRQIKEELRRRMHEPIPVQGQWLRQVVRGYFAYHAVPTNSRALGAFRYHVTNLWRRTLRRRSQKDAMTWERMSRIANAWLPRPRILHPWPNERFAVKYPSARIGHAVICAGVLSNGHSYRDPAHGPVPQNVQYKQPVVAFAGGERQAMPPLDERSIADRRAWQSTRPATESIAGSSSTSFHRVWTHRADKVRPLTHARYGWNRPSRRSIATARAQCPDSRRIRVVVDCREL